MLAFMFPTLRKLVLDLGYVFSIRSERFKAILRSAGFVVWALKIKVPDHSVFLCARNERFRQSDLLRTVFKNVVSDCIQAQLAGDDQQNYGKRAVLSGDHSQLRMAVARQIFLNMPALFKAK